MTSFENANKHNCILAIIDDPARLGALKNVAGSAGYVLRTAATGEAALRYFETNAVPELILLDQQLPDIDGHDLIRKIKSNAQTSHIPVIFLTDGEGAGNELDGFGIGAINYISKSTQPHLFLKKLELHLLLESQRQRIVSQQQELMLLRQQLADLHDNLQQMTDERIEAAIELKNAVLKTAADLVEYRDDATGKHINRVERYMSILLSAMQEHGIYADELRGLDIGLVVQASCFHDIGKVTTKESILLKPGKLSVAEFEEIKKHTTIGADIIERVKVGMNIQVPSNRVFFDYARDFAIAHHEQWNGNGYPYSLSGEDIPLLGRIMAIVDVYDALVSERPYKNALSHDKAVEIIMADKGKQFDPRIADAFYKVSDRFKDVG